MSSNPSTSDTGASAPSTESLVEMWSAWLQRDTAERRRERFWRNVRTITLALTMLTGPLLLAWYGRAYSDLPTSGNYVALVRLEGVIGADTLASAHRIVRALERAFSDARAKGVVLLVNSPGGSPVQSSIIRNRLIALRREAPTKKVWAVGEDMLTSGAYYVAVGAPHICVDASTLTGSIGVIQNSWGLDRFIERLSIERRTFTAGTSKNRLDQFLPLQPDDKRKVQSLLDSVHNQFRQVVREGRGARLHGSDSVLYSGDFWTGTDAVAMGLVDRLCSVSDVLTREFGVTEYRDYTLPPSFVDSVAHSFGMEARTQWQSAVHASPLALLPQ